MLLIIAFAIFTGFHLGWPWYVVATIMAFLKAFVLVWKEAQE